MIEDFVEKIGLEVAINDLGKLDFGTSVELDKFSVRKFSELSDVVEDEDLTLNNDPAYYMYRNVRKKGDLETIKSAGLRFDLTTIPATNLADEYIKTFGHYHPKKPGTNFAYPEMYCVISGQATYLMQRRDETGRIEDVIVCRVEPGEMIITPSDYGHVTINEIDQPIVMANWVANDFKSEYGDYQKNRGAAYYIKIKDSEFKSQNLGINYDINVRYGEIPKPKETMSAPRLILGERVGSVYQYVKVLEKLKFLTHPEDFQEELSVEQLFLP